MIVLSLVAIVFLANQTASALNNGFDAIIKARQIDPTGVPSTCVSDCQDAENLQQCTPLPQCFCTEDYNKQVLACYNCILGLSGNTALEAQSLQGGLVALEDTCKSLGSPLNSLSVNGATATTAPFPASSAAAAAANTPTNASSAPSTSPSTSGGNAASGPSPSAGSTGNGAILDVRVGPSLVLSGIIGSVVFLNL